MSTRRDSRLFLVLPALFAAAVLAEPAVAQAPAGVLVNGVQVTQDDFARELGRLGIQLGIEVPDGDYWYDRVSGLWGLRGGPAQGQMPPELNIGGALAADASTGGTGIFINGRELHLSEAAFLQQLFGYVIPGRYWLNAMGIGGFEGGPAAFNLAAAARQAGGGYTRRGPFGSMGSDGQCSATGSARTS
jgi:hypothetical protein